LGEWFRQWASFGGAGQVGLRLDYLAFALGDSKKSDRYAEGAEGARLGQEGTHEKTAPCCLGWRDSETAPTDCAFPTFAAVLTMEECGFPHRQERRYSPGWTRTNNPPVNSRLVPGHVTPRALVQARRVRSDDLRSVRSVPIRVPICCLAALRKHGRRATLAANPGATSP
jgi:hypothetical protein